MHSLGVAHRDLAPKNLVVNKQCDLKVRYGTAGPGHRKDQQLQGMAALGDDPGVGSQEAEEGQAEEGEEAGMMMMMMTTWVVLLQVIDFGLARVLPVEEAGGQLTDEVVTLFYRAPEVLATNVSDVKVRWHITLVW
jgi:serine/threonine protein kinase